MDEPRAVILREGGSIPIVTDFKKILGADSLLLGLALVAGLVWLAVRLSLAVPMTLDQCRIVIFESFKATLEEVVEADLLLHVVDVSSESAADQIASVNEVLKEIDADDKPTLMVFNKIDQLPERNGNLHWLREYPHAVCVSAKTGEGLDELQAELGMMLRPVRSCLELQAPASDGATLARIRALGQVDEERYEGDIVHLKARIPDHARAEFARFRVPE